MDEAAPTTEGSVATDPLRNRWDVPPRPVSDETAGTSAGINIEPGSNDDGWMVPPPVHLSDNTRLQLYKDGEALHAGYDAIRSATRRVCLEVYIFRSDETGRAFA